MKTWNDYVVWTRETAQYPEAGTGSPLVLSYLALGLIGEVAETLEVYESGQIEKYEHIVDEIGDCYYYVARFEDEFGSAFEFMDGVFVQPRLDEIRVANSLAGKMANDAKKVIRGDKSDRMVEVTRRVNQIGLALREFSEAWIGPFGIFHEEILVHNMNKLMDRKERNVIKGSGDKR